MTDISTLPATVELHRDGVLIATSSPTEDLVLAAELSQLWSRPSSRAHEDAGELRLTLVSSQPTTSGFDVGDVLQLRINGHTQDPVRVSAVTTTAGHTPGMWRHQVEAATGIGVLSAERIGDTPWPEEYARERWDRIVAAYPTWVAAGSWLPSGGYQQRVRARDVDNIAPLDILRATAAALHGTVVGALYGENRACVWTGSAPKIDYPRMSGDTRLGVFQALPVGGQRRLTGDPLTSSRTTDTRASLSGVVHQFHVGTGSGTETSRTTWASPRRTDGAGMLHIDSDELVATTAAADDPRIPVWLTAAQIPRRHISAALLPLGAMSAIDVATVLTPGTIRYTAITLDRAPADLEPHHLVIGSTVRVVEGRLSVEVTLEPASIAAHGPATWADTTRVDPAIRPVYADAAGAGSAWTDFAVVDHTP